MAGAALATLGLPARDELVHAVAVVELALAGWCEVAPSRAAAVALACLYTLFAVLATALVRRRAACGCFGEGESPASLVQAVISAAFALVALAGMLSVPHGVWWVLGRPATEIAVLVIGTAGSAYATVLAYSEMPQAWGSWSAR